MKKTEMLNIWSYWCLRAGAFPFVFRLHKAGTQLTASRQHLALLHGPYRRKCSHSQGSAEEGWAL